MSEAMMSAARKLGEVAARLGHPVTACPYQPSGDRLQQAAAHAWVESYLHWRPSVARAIDTSS